MMRKWCGNLRAEYNRSRYIYTINLVFRSTRLFSGSWKASVTFVDVVDDYRWNALASFQTPGKAESFPDTIFSVFSLVWIWLCKLEVRVGIR